MKLYLSDIVNAWQALLKLADKDLPIKNAYTLGKIIKVLGEERQTIEDSKVKLIKRFSVPDEENNDKLIVPPEKMEALVSEWNTFLSQQTEVNIEPISIEFFNEISYVNLSPKDMSFLIPIMKNE